MANILDKYGIKEVADVTFYEIDDNGKPTTPVLYLDTLKVSTIEQTAEQADARGGKGNPKLITWDYNKEITVTLEDALFSAKSMAVMFGNSTVSTATVSLKKTIVFTGTTDAGHGVPTYWEGPQGKKYQISSVSDSTKVKYYTASGSTVGYANLQADTQYYMVFETTTKEAGTIEIDQNSFPGTYYITGDTYARSDVTGDDEFFQFIIPKAKMSSENTITLEAEGDPSVFNMNLTVLKAPGQPLMKLVKYDLTEMAES